MIFTPNVAAAGFEPRTTWWPVQRSHPLGHRVLLNLNPWSLESNTLSTRPRLLSRIHSIGHTHNHILVGDIICMRSHSALCVAGGVSSSPWSLTHRAASSPNYHPTARGPAGASAPLRAPTGPASVTASVHTTCRIPPTDTVRASRLCSSHATTRSVPRRRNHARRRRDIRWTETC